MREIGGYDATSIVSHVIRADAIFHMARNWERVGGWRFIDLHTVGFDKAEHTAEL